MDARLHRSRAGTPRLNAYAGYARVSSHTSPPSAHVQSHRRSDGAAYRRPSWGSWPHSATQPSALVTGAFGAFIGSSFGQLIFHADVLPLLTTLAVTAGFAARPLRRLKAAGRLTEYPVTLAADDYGLTYTTPAETVAIPWNVWSKAAKRCGIWNIRLAAQPSTKIMFPASALDADQAAALTRVLAEHDLLTGVRL